MLISARRPGLPSIPLRWTAIFLCHTLVPPSSTLICNLCCYCNRYRWHGPCYCLYCWPAPCNVVAAALSACCQKKWVTTSSNASLGARDQKLPPFYFIFRKFWRDSSLAELWKSGWWYGKTVHQKSHLVIFWNHAPSMPILITDKIVETVGGFPNPPTMESLNLAMLEHHNFPGWCSNIACFFLVHIPAEISDAQA